MKIAIVTDWLVVRSGAEQVLREMLICFPEAQVFSVVDFVPEVQRDFLMGKKPTTTFIQQLPFAHKKYRSYLPLMPLAISRLDLSAFDLVISSSHAVAKGVRTRKDQLHISYVLSPMRYIWGLQEQYFKEAGYKGIKKLMAKCVLHFIKNWDVKNSSSVDYFIANSHYIAKRIERAYSRTSEVIYPPVDTEKYSLCEYKEDYYLTAGRLVPYKCINLIAKAFAKMPDKKLVIIGDGPDREKIESLLSPNITLLGYQPQPVLKEYLQKAKAFVYAAEEDFGILPVEAQACGTPVIAYNKGGLTETIISNETGVFYDSLEEQSLIEAVGRFEQQQFDPKKCRDNACRFSTNQFREQFTAFVKSKQERRRQESI